MFGLAPDCPRPVDKPCIYSDQPDNVSSDHNKRTVAVVESGTVDLGSNVDLCNRQIPDLRFEQWTDCVTTATAKPRPEYTPEQRRKYQRRLSMKKYLFQIILTTVNGFGIFASWWWPRYWWILLPFISAAIVMNITMIVALIVDSLYRSYSPEKQVVPVNPENLVLLIPCYNETKDEMERSLMSLIAQKGILGRRCIMIICDGRVRGPGMKKTTAEYLFEDILVQRDYRVQIPKAYLAWDQQFMDIEVQRGTYHGVPYLCIAKQQNQGKRDSLIVIRSFLYNYNICHQQPKTIFTSAFFSLMAAFIKESGIDKVDCLIGMDADTVFDEHCISELLQQSWYENTVGVCGYVAVDYKDSSWDPWMLYQSAEYTIAQCLRRLHQSMVTHKVSCLPGCCQLLKICEETCGDEVLVKRFGYCPTAADGMVGQIRATASEDRNHVCHMLSARPKVQTRQALRAVAYTDVPRTWAVFLSQRRRWTLGATSNDLLLSGAPGIQWFERILACTNVLTWFLNPLIFGSMVRFIYAMLGVELWVMICLVAIIMIPVVYYVMIPFWHIKRWRERQCFWIGCLMYIFCGPFINIAVLVYALYYMDSFGWGKTRQVISEDKGFDEETGSRPTEQTPLLQHT